MTLYLTDVRFHGGENLLENAAAVATVIPTPTVQRGDQNIIYSSVTAKLVINGTNFREKVPSQQRRRHLDPASPPLLKRKQFQKENNIALVPLKSFSINVSERQSSSNFICCFFVVFLNSAT